MKCCGICSKEYVTVCKKGEEKRAKRLLEKKKYKARVVRECVDNKSRPRDRDRIGLSVFLVSLHRTMRGCMEQLQKQVACQCPVAK